MKITINFTKNPKQFNQDIMGVEPDAWITVGGHTEQKGIFDKENPYWADFFKDRN